MQRTSGLTKILAHTREIYDSLNIIFLEYFWVAYAWWCGIQPSIVFAIDVKLLTYQTTRAAEEFDNFLQGRLKSGSMIFLARWA
jgi:hypothetical protein